MCKYLTNNVINFNIYTDPRKDKNLNYKTNLLPMTLTLHKILSILLISLTILTFSYTAISSNNIYVAAQDMDDSDDDDMDDSDGSTGGGSSLARSGGYGQAPSSNTESNAIIYLAATAILAGVGTLVYNYKQN